MLNYLDLFVNRKITNDRGVKTSAAIMEGLMTEAPDLFDSKKLTQPVGTVEVYLLHLPSLLWALPI